MLGQLLAESDRCELIPGSLVAAQKIGVHKGINRKISIIDFCLIFLSQVISLSLSIDDDLRNI